jgi:hypothetical protein
LRSWALAVAKGYRPDRSAVPKRTGGSRSASCEKSFRRKSVILKSNRRRGRRCQRPPLQIPVQLTTPTRCKTYCADEAENAAAVACVRKQYPTLKIVGRCHGYLRGEALRAKVAEINALAPDDPRLYSCHRPRGGPRTALKLLLEGHSGGAFNLGTGNGFSVREILAAIAAETGREVPHVVKPRRSGDPTYLVADPSAARDIELPSRPFGPGHDHPHRLGVAQKGAPAEDGCAGSRVSGATAQAIAQRPTAA